jgi:SAM-dependent methyltransferase
MPDIASEKQEYDRDYQWPEGGHEWSKPWGSAADQWVTTIYRRIFRLLPTRTILEIAPGFGRWTPYLLAASTRYWGIDIAERCIVHCRRSFGPLASRPRFLLGDGLHLRGIADGSISLAYSFDSLVHVDFACLSSYATELYRVLEPGGHAFLHHSNLGEYVANGVLTVPNRFRRDPTVSAENAMAAFRHAGFVSLVHEKTQWLGHDAANDPFCDCISLILKPAVGAPAHDQAASVYNRWFINEVAYCRALAEHYKYSGS